MALKSPSSSSQEALWLVALAGEGGPAIWSWRLELQTQAPAPGSPTPLTIHPKEQRKGAYVRTAVIRSKEEAFRAREGRRSHTSVRWK